MLKSLAAHGAACVLACAPTLSLAQAYPQAPGPAGGYISPTPSLIFVQACNGGLGGFVGSTYDGAQCTVATQSTAGLGAMQAVPPGSTNGTALGALPSGATGARLYLAAADSVTFTVASTAPAAAPSATFTVSGASGGTGPNWDENLSGGQMLYITATTGSPKFRWY